jgi:hypothetical protein
MKSKKLIILAALNLYFIIINYSIGLFIQNLSFIVSKYNTQKTD